MYINRPDPIVFLPVVVDTTDRIHDDFSRLLFRYPNREVLALGNEILFLNTGGIGSIPPVLKGLILIRTVLIYIKGVPHLYKSTVILKKRNDSFEGIGKMCCKLS